MLMVSFQKEWLLFRRDGRLLWLLLTLLIMMILGIASSSYQYQQTQLLKSQANAAERDRWINQGEKNPHSAAHYGIYLFKPDTPLSVIDPGTNRFQGEILFLEAHKRNNPAFSNSQNSIELQRLGTLNPATILQLLLPLFVILCGFGFFAGEREQGTLRMLLLSGKTPRQLFLQKFIALLSFSLLFLIPIGAYSGVMLLTKGDLDFYRLTTMTLFYLGYLMFWILLTLVVSVVAKTARQSLTVLLIFWVITSLIVPKLAIDAATNAHSGISAQEFYSRMESDLYTPERLDAIKLFKQDTLKQYGVSSIDDLPFNWAGAELLFGESYSDKVFDEIFEQHLQKLKQQDSTYQRLALFSPLMSIQIISSALATTDWQHHQLFASSAEQYRRRVMQMLNENVRDHKHEGHTGNEQLWSTIPAFTYQSPAISQILDRYTNALISFGVWLLLIAMVSGVAIRRLSREGSA
jgi:ABC-2 type transport system permease protein